MKRTTATPATLDGFGAIRADEVMPLREAARRMGWGQKTIRMAQRSGLEVVELGRMKYCTGRAVLAFFEHLAVQQHGEAGGVPE